MPLLPPVYRAIALLLCYQAKSRNHISQSVNAAAILGQGLFPLPFNDNHWYVLSCTVCVFAFVSACKQSDAIMNLKLVNPALKQTLDATLNL